MSSSEIKRIKSQLKEKRFAKKKIDKINTALKTKEEKKNIVKTGDSLKKIIKKNDKDTVDICKLIDKCSIEEISKYLIQKEKKKSFPDITIRQ